MGGKGHTFNHTILFSICKVYVMVGICGGVMALENSMGSIVLRFRDFLIDQINSQDFTFVPCRMIV